jgi:hypothetical protein
MDFHKVMTAIKEIQVEQNLSFIEARKVFLDEQNYASWTDFIKRHPNCSVDSSPFASSL